jgi:hypothetical protein
MSISEEVKLIESMLPRTMLRDRAIISYRLKRIKSPDKGHKDAGKSPSVSFQLFFQGL